MAICSCGAIRLQGRYILLLAALLVSYYRWLYIRLAVTCLRNKDNNGLLQEPQWPSTHRHKMARNSPASEIEIPGCNNHFFLFFKWEANTTIALKKAQQRLFLRRLKEFSISQKGMIQFHCAPIESLTFARQEMAWQRDAGCIKRKLPSLAEIYSTWLQKKGHGKILKDNSQPTNHLFQFPPFFKDPGQPGYVIAVY